MPKNLIKRALKTTGKLHVSTKDLINNPCFQERRKYGTYYSEEFTQTENHHVKNKKQKKSKKL